MAILKEIAKRTLGRNFLFFKPRRYVKSCGFLCTSRSFQSRTAFDMEKEILKMKKFLPDVINDVTVFADDVFDEVPELKERLESVLEYNLINGKMLRANIFLLSHQKLLENNPNAEDKNIYRLAWCIEIFQAYQILVDDILDNAPLRRGQLSWYFENDNDLLCFYDGLILYEHIFTLLKTFFSDSKYYLQMMELFHNINFRTISAQVLDNLSHKKLQSKQLNTFNMELYTFIVINKTAYYTFYLPMILALLKTESYNLKILEIVKHFCLKIGYLWQIQDDYLDCYGIPSVTGKECTDIGEGKLTWFAAEAIKICDQNQLLLFKENYGHNNEENVQNIKQLYNQLDMEQRYKTFEQKVLIELGTEIRELSDPVLKDIFQHILFIIGGRNK